ncbi:MAG: AMP-binding protein [Bacteroidales bacterium]|nr:AMP-binding protein [Bacteroidales bacterium]
MILVQHFLENSAERLPEKTALICDGQYLSYNEIEKRANSLAQALIANNLQRGERVILFMPNSIELVISIFAVLKADGVFVVINSSTKYEKLLYILKDSLAAGLITSGNQKELFLNLQKDLPELKIKILKQTKNQKIDGVISFETILNTFPAKRPVPKNIDVDLACLVYTSGSTGEPKGVMSDHNNVVFAATSVTTYLENTEEDIVLNFLPFSFDYGLYQLIMTFKFGGTLVLEKGFTFPGLVLKRMEEEKVSGFPGVTTVFNRIIRMELEQYDLSSIRYLTNTAEALPPEVILRLQQKFPAAKVFSMYGLTETQRTLYMPPDKLNSRLDSVGIAIPGTEVWLIDEEGNRLEPGSSGELVVRGRHVMRGYWNDSASTAKRFRPGQIPGERICYTNDLFRMDEEGYLYFIARKDDILKCGGEKVSPVEIEKVLYKLEGIIEAAVIGVPDPIQGQTVKAFIVTDKTDLSAKQVLAHCRVFLEDYMMPRMIEFRDQLPKTISNKIKKSALK